MSGIIGVSPDMRSGVVGKPPIGSVIQTVYNEATTENSITGTHNSSPTNTEADGTIVPRFASSKILGMFDVHLRLHNDGSSTDGGVGMKIYDSRTSSYIYVDGADAHMGLYIANSANSGDQNEWRGRHSIKFLIDAGTTASRVYTVFAWKYPSSNSPVVYAHVNASKSHIILQEISN